MFSSLKHLCTKVTPDFQLTKLQWGKSKDGIKMIEIDNGNFLSTETFCYVLLPLMYLCRLANEYEEILTVL